MTKEEFLAEFNGAPYDDEELAEVALYVDGSVGEAAKQFLVALNGFNEALEAIGYERG